MQKEVLIIIPAYNEEKNISKVLDRLEQPEIAEFADILVMNDASSDNTNWIVKARHHAVEMCIRDRDTDTSIREKLQKDTSVYRTFLQHYRFLSLYAKESEISEVLNGSPELINTLQTLSLIHI